MGWQQLKWLGLGLSVLLVGCRSLPTTASRDLQKCVWVNRWDYRSAGDINRVMRECADAGFTTVMFQVRGNGTALYSSREEVWSEQFGFKGPPFDPLSQAVVSAHAIGLKIHAWINVLPGWRGDKPPSERRQLFHTRPEWFLRASAVPGQGRAKIVKEGSYFWLNPCLPEVRSYLAGICREVADEYEVDGIHLDYIRFPDAKEAGKAPADPRSAGLFKRSGYPDTKSGFMGWKTKSVTELVVQVRQQLDMLRRPVALTAAVYADLDKARNRLRQDWPDWARRRLIDAVFPMIYNVDNARFNQLAASCVSAAGSVPVVVGVGAHWHQAPAQTVAQMDAALARGAGGVAVYGYAKTKEPAWSAVLSTWSGGGVRKAR